MQVLPHVMFLKLAVTACLGILPAGLLDDTAVNQSLLTNLVEANSSPPTEQVIIHEVPYFPIESPAGNVCSTLDSQRRHTDPVQRVDDAALQHNSREELSLDDTTDNADSNAESCPFRNVSYSVLTPEYAFAGKTESPFLAFRKSTEPTGLAPANSGQSEPWIAANKKLDQIGDSNSLQHPERRSGRPVDDIVNRPMSAIKVGAVFVPVTSTGERLPVPESNLHDHDSYSRELHHLAFPQTVSQPTRDVFPFQHQPLYFEDPNMERCGDSVGCLTEFTSIAHFAVRIPLLPYLMASDPPHECVQALPDCPTCCKFGPEAYIPRPTVKALGVQAAATTGFIFLIP